ncbi:MAG TPA: beta-propeller domain-containing protein [Verrucomicrobiae bacterium]|nr:beta-propeller domain-containing protein [Verrucomicrobiae bacterium]
MRISSRSVIIERTWRFSRSLALTFALYLVPASFTANDPSARIAAVHLDHTNLVVDVEASGSLARITLESSPRLPRKVWEPRAVQVLDETNAGAVSLTFTIPISPATEILRLRGDLPSAVLPASFYDGTNKFLAASAGSTTGAGAGAILAPGVDNNTAAPPTTQRDVVESDIWNLDGDTLYFFNQYRGLQVIDVSNPDAPVLTGTYDLAAAGEQMYLLDHTRVVLLARDNCGWFGNSSDSRVILLDITNGVPHLVKELPVPGYIDESRMVGTALYVVASGYEPRAVPLKDGTGTSVEWDWGSTVVSFDLSDFGAAQQKSSDWVAGYGNVILANDEYLFVAQSNYDSSGTTSLIYCYDISAPDGTFTMLSRIKVAGAIRDKFKMQANGDVFTVVPQLDFPNPRATFVETFSLADPTNPKPLGTLRLIDNEQLFATSFDGNRLYVVTYYIKDPLWIIDLSDPSAPNKVGELQIPGWSTFLQPLGDKLLAIGIDQTNNYWRTSVQLFDVANPAQPALLSKVLIGDQWSGSEANWDEKAFGVLPDDKLLLVPFQSSGTNGYFQGVQLIDLEADHLVKRGVIPQNVGARRATVHLGRILSLSGTELLTVDETDRDNPKVVANTPLSWEADRVHLAGNYVIEVDTQGSDGPLLRVVNSEDSSVLLKTVALKNLPYMGSTKLGDRLYVLQGQPIQYTYPTVYDPTNYFPIATNPAVFLFSEFDLTRLPDVSLVAQTEKDGSTNAFYGQYEALQVKSDLLVWRSKNSGYPIIYFGAPGGGGPIALAGAADASGAGNAGSLAPTSVAPGIVGGGIVRPIPYWGGAAGHLIAVSLAGDQPSFASEVLISATNNWWNFSGAFTAGGLVFTSHENTEFDPDIDPPPYTYPCYDGKNYVTCTNDPPPGVWVQRYYLDVVDFNDPTDPLVRQPVNVPGSLIGIDHGGEVLFTRGYDVAPDLVYTGNESVASLSYDGVEAHFVSTLPITNNWPRPTIVNNGYVYFGNSGPNGTNGTLEVWGLDERGQFQLRDSVGLDSPAQQLEEIGNLLAIQGNQISIFDATDAGAPKPIGGGTANTCYGVLLDGADGDISRGLWVPIGWYGVIKIPVNQKP